MIVVIYLLHTIGERSLLAPAPAFYGNSVDEEFGAWGCWGVGFTEHFPFSCEVSPQPHFLLY